MSCFFICILHISDSSGIFSSFLAGSSCSASPCGQAVWKMDCPYPGVAVLPHKRQCHLPFRILGLWHGTGNFRHGCFHVSFGQCDVFLDILPHRIHPMIASSCHRQCLPACSLLYAYSSALSGLKPPSRFSSGGSGTSGASSSLILLNPLCFIVPSAWIFLLVPFLICPHATWKSRLPTTVHFLHFHCSSSICISCPSIIAVLKDCVGWHSALHTANPFPFRVSCCRPHCSHHSTCPSFCMLCLAFSSSSVCFSFLLHPLWNPSCIFL